MYWTLFQVLLLTCAPILPVGVRITRPDPTKNEWIFTCQEWKAAWQLAREVYLEYYPPVKTE